MSYDAIWYIVAENKGNYGHDPISVHETMLGAEESCQEYVQLENHCFNRVVCAQVFEAIIKYMPLYTVGEPIYEDDN